MCLSCVGLCVFSLTVIIERVEFKIINDGIFSLSLSYNLGNHSAIPYVVSKRQTYIQSKKDHSFIPLNCEFEALVRWTKK